ncbi:MAG TPA: hypothetical protein VFH95_13455 [Candidatus Kapabacteria bacterium]|nr:hypothetical protein [Candidatus Kapabacteria bacterium]
MALLAGIAVALSAYTPRPLHAQLLPIGSRDATVDSCLSKWPIVASDLDASDSVCLGAKFWDLDGHLLFHIDSVEHTLTKVDWSSYMPIGRPHAETIAQQIEDKLGHCDRARNHDWVYWIWDNDDIHYLLAYGNGTLRMLEFQDQGSLDACMFH